MPETGQLALAPRYTGMLPLFPHQSSALLTLQLAATACDEAFRFMMGLRRQPALRVLPAYYDDDYMHILVHRNAQAEAMGNPQVQQMLAAHPDALPEHGDEEAYRRRGQHPDRTGRSRHRSAER